MKITKRQLRKLIQESISGSRYYKTRPRNPLKSQMKHKSFKADEDHIFMYGNDDEITGLSPTEDYEKLKKLTDHEDEAIQRTGYTLATTLQNPELVIPNEGEPYEELPYEGDDYLDDLRAYEERNPTVDTALMSNQKIVSIPIPRDLVDEVISRHRRAVELENQGVTSSNMGRDGYKFTEAARAIYSHIDSYIELKLGYDLGRDLDSYGFGGASGYRAKEYEKAMEKAGEYM